MEKIWRLSLLTLLSIALLLPAAAFAEEDTLVALRLDTVEGQNSGDVSVTLSMENTQQVKSLQCNLNYDPAALTVVSVEPGTVFPGEYTVSNPDTAGLIRIACAALEVSGDGPVLTVHFQPKGQAGGAVTITDASVTRYSEAEGVTNAYLTITDGGVSVGGALPAPAVTPWAAPTPPPTPTPEPSPTPQPTPQYITEDLETPAPVDTPAPAPAEATVGPISYVMVAVLSAACALLIFLGLQQKRQGKRKRR